MVISRSAVTSWTSDSGSRWTATFIPLNSGMNFETGSLSRTFPSSTIIRTATPVTGLVDEAMRKSVSLVIGCLDSRSLSPWASKCTTRPLRATSVTAARDVAIVDMTTDDLVDPVEALGRDADLLGLGPGQVVAGDGPRRGQEGHGRERGEEDLTEDGRRAADRGALHRISPALLRIA